MQAKNINDLKNKVSKIITLLEEAQTTADQIPKINSKLHTSFTSITTSVIDLNYLIHNLMDQSHNKTV